MVYMLPENFTHLYQDRKFLRATFPSKYCTIIGKDGNIGRRYIFWLFCIEYYTGDLEPELDHFFGLRLVVWYPVFKKNLPQGWKRSRISGTPISIAIVNINNIGSVYKNWSSTFRRYYHARNIQNRYVITELSLEEFIEYYSLYFTNNAFIKKIYLRIITQHGIESKYNSYGYILTDSFTNQIVAGIAVVDSAVTNQSYYIAAFTRKELAPAQSGLWLCSYWMEKSSARGIGFANFGVLWTQGQPVSWKGYSDFKMKFNPIIHTPTSDMFRFTFSLF